MKKEFLTALLLLGVFLAGFAAGNYFEITPKNTEGAAVANKQKDDGASSYAKKLISYDKAMKSDKPSLVLFYVDWCGYCQRFAPYMPELKKKYKNKMNMVMVNCEDEKTAEIRKNYEISGFPTVYIVDPSKNVSQFIGHYAPQEETEKVIDEYLKNRK